MTTGALLLAVSAIFATKANKKFANIKTAHGIHLGVATGYVVKNESGTLCPMTSSGTNPQLQVFINGTTEGFLYTGTTTSTSKVLYR